jgi:ribonuclease J
VVSVAVNKKNELLSDPRVSAPGSLDPVEDKELIAALGDEIADTVERAKPKDGPDKISDAIRNTMRKFLREELGKKPVIDIHVIKV